MGIYHSFPPLPTRHKYRDKTKTKSDTEFFPGCPLPFARKPKLCVTRHTATKSVAFCSFCVFAGKNAVYLANQSCKGGKSVGRDDWLWLIKKTVLSKAAGQSLRIPLWHPKSPSLLKPSSQSPRIQLTLNSVIRMPISNKEGTAYGGPGVLWHIKIRYLPNAVSQSLRIQLALNSLIRTPVSLPANYPQNSASPNSGVLAQGFCTRDGFFDAKTSLPFV